MTGYGRSESVIGNKKISLEIKSLNSKGLDMNVKIPSLYRSKEMKIRTFLASQLTRGKCDVYLNYEVLSGEQNHQLNKPLLGKYLEDIKSFAAEMNLPESNESEYLSVLMKMPEALVSTKEELKEEDWEATFQMVKDANQAFQDFRLEEGKSLYSDLSGRIESIGALLKQIEPFESERTETVKARIEKNLQEISDPSKVDQNRFEQELIYYIEKYDVSEEKVRLSAHLEHFIKTMNEESDQGKKLGFISQEIGREINTLGSKANHAEMQKIVVVMKDELEKIKEQVLNTL